MTEPMMDTQNSLRSVADLVYATADTARFGEKNGFLTLSIRQTGENGPEEKQYDRVFLHRAFPFDAPWEFISVCDGDGKELALIEKLDDLSEEQRVLIRKELDRKYYYPVIKRILSVNERYGFSYWKVETDSGERSFTLQDTYRSIHKIDLHHIFITDVDGNRYDIPDVEALDNHSYRKIELFL